MKDQPEPESRGDEDPQFIVSSDIPIDTAEFQELEKVQSASSRIEFPPSIWGRTTPELAMFVFIIGCASQVSTLAIPSFFPTIPVLADYFATTTENINLTATIYSIFQGLSPLFWGGLSDSYGRRPVYIACLALAIAANFALARINTYGALFGLRILQAFGGASTVSLLSAVVGDITERKNRGGVQSFMASFQSLGNTVGPLVGGALMERWSWRAVFWFLACHALLFWVLIIVFIPETNRHFCGNGSILPSNWWHVSPYAYYHRKRYGTPLLPKDEGYADQWLPPPHRRSWFRWLYLLKQIDVFLVLVPNALIYTTWYMILTSMSTDLMDNQHFDSLQVGLCYLPSGVGAIIASVTAGRTMNWNYKRRTRQFERKCEQDGVEFDPSMLNIYQLRLESTVIVVVLMCACTLAYAWTMHFHVHYLAPVILTFPISLCATFFLSTSTVILVDLFPDDSAASTSCVNLTRCLLCAAGLAALDKMQTGMTVGGTFTLMAGLCGLSWGCIWTEMKFGGQFADQRRVRERERHRREREEQREAAMKSEQGVESKPR